MDFLPRRHGVAAWLSLAAGVGLLAAALVQYSQARGERSALSQQFDHLHRQQQRLKAAHRAHVQLPPERIEAINRAITALNTPWSELLDAVESALAEDTALLDIAPERGELQATLAAESDTPQGIIRFVDALQDHGFFSDALLREHRREDRIPGRPYGFAVTVHWRDTP